MKKFLCAIVTVAMVSLLSVSAFATDYPSEPDGSEYITTPDDGDGKTAKTPASIPQASVVKDAITNKTPVYVTDNAVVKAEVISAIADAEAPVTFVAANGVSMTIDPKTITAVKDLNLSFAITDGSDAKDVPSTVSTDVLAKSLVIKPADVGNFGLTVKLTIPAATIPTNVDVSKAHLYYIDDNGKIKDYGAVIVNEAGDVEVEISHASQYVITAEKLEVTAGQSGTDDNNGTNENPGTGVTLSVTATIVTLAAVVLTKARKK